MLCDMVVLPLRRMMLHQAHTMDIGLFIGVHLDVEAAD